MFSLLLIFFLSGVLITPLLSSICSLATNRIGDVMVSVLASSVVDRGFEPRSD